MLRVEAKAYFFKIKLICRNFLYFFNYHLCRQLKDLNSFEEQLADFEQNLNYDVSFWFHFKLRPLK